MSIDIKEIKNKDYYSLKELKLLAKKISTDCSEREIITLSGPLGVGKSTFAKYFIKYFLNEEIEVTSPTYTIVQRYNSYKRPEVWHMDFYRLKNDTNVDDLDLNEAFEKAVCLIEWPEKLNHIIPQKRIDLNFDFVSERDDIRKITYRL